MTHASQASPQGWPPQGWLIESEGMCSFWLRASVQKGPPHSPGHCSMPRKYSYETQLLVGRVVPFMGNRNLGRHVRHALLGGSAANWDQIWSRPSCLLPQLHRPHGTWRKAASNRNANSVQTCGGNLATSETLAQTPGLAPRHRSRERFGTTRKCPAAQGLRPFYSNKFTHHHSTNTPFMSKSFQTSCVTQ